MNAGDVLAGRYQLLELIGAGGMGEVWRAKQQALGREVAIKVLFSGRRSQMKERFQREAELVAKVEHRNVIDVIDFGQTASGEQFLVMPFLVGETLEARLLRPPAATVVEVISTMRGVLSGLAAIHDAGIVHRDLKPANVFLVRDADGVVPKLLDFGISRDEANDTGLTQEGMMMGTPHYMAPEQFESARTVDRRADIFGAGAMLYEALSGCTPFHGPDPFAIYRAILGGDATPLQELRPDLPPDLVAVVHRAIARAPEDRFDTVRDLRAAIDAVVQAGQIEGVQAAMLRSLGDTTDRSLGAREVDTSPSAMAPTAMAPGPTGAESVPGPAHPKAQPIASMAPPSKRGLVIGALVLAAVIASAGAAFVFWPRTPLPAPTPMPTPAPTAAAAPSEEPDVGDTRVRLATSERLNPLALRWARLDAGDRRLVRFGSHEGDWALFCEGTCSPALAESLGGELASVEHDGPLAQAQLFRTTVRVNLRERPDRESPTVRVVAQDTIVVGFDGPLRDEVSRAPEGSTFAVSSFEEAGWSVNHFFEPYAGCLPLPGPLVRDSELAAQPLRRSASFARSQLHLEGAEHSAYVMTAVDTEASKSAVGVYAADSCRPGEQLRLIHVAGVLDEHFLTDTGDQSFLVASWFDGPTPPSSGMRRWAAWDLATGQQVWSDELPTAATLPPRRIVAVSGSRDRALRNRPSTDIVLVVRGPGRARRQIAMEAGRFVENAR